MKRKPSPQDEHWANWQKRHRAPRAIDVLLKTRREEAARKKAETTVDETFDVEDEDVEKSF
jgi:hypothetical protein